MSDTASVVGLEQVQSEAFSRLFGRVVRLRVALAPVMFTVLFVLLASDPAPWRFWLLGGIALVAGTRVWIEFRRFRGASFERTMKAVASWTPPLFFGVVLVTGGISSPLLPVVLPVTFFFSFFVGFRQSLLYLAGMSATIWLVAWVSLRGILPQVVPAALGGGDSVFRTDTAAWWLCGGYQFALFWATGMSRALRGALHEMVDRALRARDEVLATTKESTQALTTLSAEIAHELKNPLASVKGLAALVDRDLDGKARERMTVLRREVDRMQEVLDSFLNFSRPLVPLSLSTVRLRALCEEVAALHEGHALERGIVLRVLEEAPLEVKADSRKLKQVLINLLQNALEASPNESQVDLVVRRTVNGARIDVRDRGEAVTPESLLRAFEPGVTSKAKGSGLGLTVARMLARQHGGELSLRVRAEGGCEAALTLPEVL